MECIPKKIALVCVFHMRIYVSFLAIHVSSATVENSLEELESVPIHRYIEPVSVNLTDWETQMLTAQ